MLAFASARKELIRPLLLLLPLDRCDALEELVRLLSRQTLTYRAQPPGDLPLEDLYLSLVPLSTIIGHRIAPRCRRDGGTARSGPRAPIQSRKRFPRQLMVDENRAATSATARLTMKPMRALRGWLPRDDSFEKPASLGHSVSSRLGRRVLDGTSECVTPSQLGKALRYRGAA